jgi:WXG100 family type VII secretion target
MQYNSGQIQGLLSELASHHAALGQHQSDATSAHGQLASVWQGGAVEEFSAAHGKLMKSLQDVQDVLHQGITGVQNAHDAATSTDSQVGRSFSA